MSLRISALSQEREAARMAFLERAARLCGSSLPLSPSHTQALFDVVRGEFAEDTDAVTAVGIAFGELIKAAGDFEWVWADDDEFGGEVSLAAKGYDGVCYPISMIEKRIERNEDVSLTQLRDDNIWTIHKSIAEGHCAPRDGFDAS